MLTHKLAVILVFVLLAAPAASDTPEKVERCGMYDGWIDLYVEKRNQRASKLKAEEDPEKIIVYAEILEKPQAIFDKY